MTIARLSSAMRTLLAAAAVLAFLAPATASAQSLTWRVQSLHSSVVDLEFYSETRKWVWPGEGKVYVLRDSKVQEFKLTCNRGEKVCFGAWVRGRSQQFWGGGQDNKQLCDNCCYLCNGQVTDTRILRP